MMFATVARRRRMVAVAALATLLLAAAWPPAWAQSSGVPARAAADIDRVIANSQAAGEAQSPITGARLSSAVVDGIAHYPASVTPIVALAVQRAPQFQAAIVRDATLAFPGFATQIAAAADGYAVPTSYAAPAAGVPSSGGWRGLSELRFGIVDHDTGVFGRNKESGPDITLGARFTPLTGWLWDSIWNPRVSLGLNINTSGDTSTAYLALNWDWKPWDRVYLSFGWGGAVHDGETGSGGPLDRKELGSPLLFYAAVEIGYRVLGNHGVSVRLDHMSNAGLTSDNEGLDTVGVVYSYFF